MAAPSPRRAAYNVLMAWDGGHARLEKLLGRELGRLAALAPRDKAMAQGLVFAVLRNLLWLDHLLTPCLSRPVAKLDQPVKWVLRLGAAELGVLGAPDHAAVSAAVDLAKATPARRGQKLVNAALRKLARTWREAALPDPAGDPAGHLALRHSHPRWLVELLLADHPFDFVEQWLAANQRPAPRPCAPTPCAPRRRRWTRRCAARPRRWSPTPWLRRRWWCAARPARPAPGPASPRGCGRARTPARPP